MESKVSDRGLLAIMEGMWTGLVRAALERGRIQAWVRTSTSLHLGKDTWTCASPALIPSHFLIRLYSMFAGWWWMRYWSVITTDIIHVPGMCGPGCSASSSRKQWYRWQVAFLHCRFWFGFILSVCPWLQNRYLERRNKHVVCYTSWLCEAH